jgi:hypothetical protein
MTEATGATKILWVLPTSNSTLLRVGQLYTKQSLNRNVTKEIIAISNDNTQF